MRRALLALSAVVVLLAVVVVGSSGLVAKSMTQNQDRDSLRSRATKLYTDNNFAEALAGFQQLALDPQNNDPGLAQDFEMSVQCLLNLDRLTEFDAYFENAVKVHAAHWRLQKQAALTLSGGVDSGGFLIAGEFERGSHRGGGQYADASARDRVRSLQLLLAAIELAKQDPAITLREKSDNYKHLADAMGEARYGEAWKLQDLTDLTTLPDYDSENGDAGFGFGGGRGFGGWGSENKGAPVDATGQPVFHKLPASWETASSDGERWRWALDQAAKTDPARISEIELEWAGFLDSQFGVGGSAVGPVPVIRTGAVKADAAAEELPVGQTESGAWVAHLLADTETVAKLTTGVRRFTLPEEFNPITIFKRVVARNDDQKASALESLISVRMNRHQYAQAAELLKQLLATSTDKDFLAATQARIDQILGNWLQFSGASVQPAGQGATFDIRYRNGKKVTFEASPIDITRLLNDLKAYLQSGPKELDYQRLQLDNIGWMLIQADQKKYVGAPTAKWELELSPPADHFDAVQTVATPLQKAGAWWVTARMADGNETRMVVWLADTAISRKRVVDGTLYYVADATTGKPIARADLEFFGWQQKQGSNRRDFTIETSRFADRSDENGLCVPLSGKIDPHFQWLTIARTADGRMAFDGFRGVWLPQPLDAFSYNPLKVYSITDRPVYRPGHDVKFRMWVRQPRFDESDDTQFANKDYFLQVRNPKGDVVHDQAVKTDRWGGVDGQWTIPADATLGDYTLAICDSQKTKLSKTRVRQGAAEVVTEDVRNVIGQGSFKVEEYRKPEYDVTIEAPDKPVQLGEKIQAKVIAKYFFGAPVTEAKVHYKVERTKKDSRWYPVATWDWLYSPGYWWFAPEYLWYPGWQRWGCLPPMPPWRNWNPDPPEIVAEGDAPIGPDGTLLIDIDTAAALQSHSDSDHNYRITAEVVDQSRRTIIGTGSVLVAREPFRVFVWTDRGHYQTGDTVSVGFQARTADGKPVTGTGKASLFSVSYGANSSSDKPVEKEVAAFDVETDASGSGTLKLTVPQSGQYRIAVRVSDSEGRQQEGGYVMYVRGPAENGTGYRFNALELITDKRDYQPGDTVRLQINTNKPDSTVLLFVRPMNGLCPKPLVLRLNGKSTVHELRIDRADMPNIFVEAMTISDGQIHSEAREIVVPPEQRIATVEVLPSATRYRPGEQAKVRLKLTGIDGRPFVGNTVVSVYDASLEAIAASSIPEIRSFFWNARRYHHVSNESTLQRGSQPVPLESETQMQMLFGNDPAMMGFGGQAAFGGGGMGGGFGGGGLGGGGRQFRGRGMPEPMMMMEGAAMSDMAAPMAGAMLGEALMAKSAAGPGSGAAAEVQPTVRSSFADTAHWVASVESDADGIVEVTFTVPDNLTTWKIKAWTLGDGTRVGSGSSDVISSKDLIIRPQTPRFFLEKDLITLSAVVHNYLDAAKSTRIVLETEGGQLQIMDGPEQTVEIAAGGEARVNWTVRVVSSGTTKVRMKALTDTESDATELTLPVHVHGMLKTESFTGVIRPDGNSAKVELTVPTERLEQQSRLEIRYSPSLAGAMVDALPYLIDYPYGCTEQTLNRFLPAVITQQTLRRMGVNLADVQKKRTNLNAQELGNAADRAAQWKRYDTNPVFDEDELRLIVASGIKALTEMQLSDGGWGWFSGYGEHSTAHLTSQVVHGLIVAEKNDAPILPDVLERGVAWLTNYQATELTRLREGDWRREHPDQLVGRTRSYKMQADNMDAFVAFVLSEKFANDPAMSDYLYRDRGDLAVYAKALTGLVLHAQDDAERRNMLLRNIEQMLVKDDENQTAWLKIPQDQWWYWYNSEIEAQAMYLKLLLVARPQDETASRLVKYLLNNRKHGTYWNSTRDTALMVESLAEYIAVTGEDRPEMTIEVLIDGVVQKTVKVNGENLFSFDNVVLLEGDAVKSGRHQVEIRRTGKGPVYFNAYLTNFTKEDSITATGLEVKVDRRFYRLERDDTSVTAQGDRGQVVKQQTAKFKRIPLDNPASVTSGELIEVELILESKNDYEYLMLQDRKPSGFEPDDQRSGYVWEGLRAYRELRDDRVSFFLSDLARGRHSISYRLRAESPGQLSALPATIEGMYAPELVGNSDEFKLRVSDPK